MRKLRALFLQYDRRLSTDDTALTVYLVAAQWLNNEKAKHHMDALSFNVSHT